MLRSCHECKRIAAARVVAAQGIFLMRPVVRYLCKKHIMIYRMNSDIKLLHFGKITFDALSLIMVPATANCFFGFFFCDAIIYKIIFIIMGIFSLCMFLFFAIDYKKF